MEINFIREEGNFIQIQTQWNRLLNQSISDVPFLRHEFQIPWWRSLGGGEWDNGDLWIASGTDTQGELLGLAPLFRTVSNEGVPSFMFIGSREISDYLDLIVAEKNLHMFVQILFGELDKLPRTVWEQIDLYNLPEWSPSISVIREYSIERGWKVEQEKLQPCPIVFFKGDWEAYLSQLKKKQRHELRRKLRRAEANEQSIALRVISTREELEDGINAFVMLMAYDQKKAEFLTSKMRSHLSAMITMAFENGWLMLAFLELNGEPIAGHLNFDYRDRLWIYNSGVNPDYNDLSPGWVLFGYIIQWAIENDRNGIDFLRGDEEYKYRLGAENRFIHRLKLSR